MSPAASDVNACAWPTHATSTCARVQFLDSADSFRGEAKNGACHWFRPPITVVHKKEKKNGLIMLWIIYLLGSSIGKNGLIIGNRFTALRKELRPTPQSLLIFLVSPSSFTSKPKYYKRLGRSAVCFFLLFISTLTGTMAAPLFPRRIIFSAKSPTPPFVIGSCFSTRARHVAMPRATTNTPVTGVMRSPVGRWQRSPQIRFDKSFQGVVAIIIAGTTAANRVPCSSHDEIIRRRTVRNYVIYLRNDSIRYFLGAHWKPRESGQKSIFQH